MTRYLTPYVALSAVLAAGCAGVACLFLWGDSRAEHGVGILFALVSLVAAGLAGAAIQNSAKAASHAGAAVESEAEAPTIGEGLLRILGSHGEAARRLVEAVLSGADVDCAAAWDTRISEEAPGAGWFRVAGNGPKSLWMSPAVYTLNGEPISLAEYEECQAVLSALQRRGQIAAERSGKDMQSACLAPFAADAPTAPVKEEPHV